MKKGQFYLLIDVKPHACYTKILIHYTTQQTSPNLHSLIYTSILGLHYFS